MATSLKTISKSIIKSLGSTPSDFTDLDNTKLLLQQANLEGLLTLPVNDFDVHINTQDGAVLVNFLNLSVFQNNGRGEKVTRKTLNNYVLNTLDSYPDQICIFTDSSLPSGKNLFVGMKSTGKPTLKKYINTSIRGGVIMSSIEPNDPDNNNKTSIFQLFSFNYFKTKSDFIIRE